jgi:broad specificity phosphatase PhoE
MIHLADFYFIRHGETDWNLEHRGMGQKNIPLNARGLEQAHEAAKVLAHEAIRTICHSPLDRAKDTAKIIAANKNCQRALRGINKGLQLAGPILIVSHGGVFWAVQQFGQLGKRFDLRNVVPIFLRAPVQASAPWSASELA